MVARSIWRLPCGPDQGVRGGGDDAVGLLPAGAAGLPVVVTGWKGRGVSSGHEHGFRISGRDNTVEAKCRVLR